MRRAICLQIAPLFWVCGGSVSLSCSMSMGLVILGRQTYIHTAEPLVPQPSTFEVEMAVEKLKRHKSLCSDQIPAELIKTGGRTFTMRSINLLFLFGIRRNFLKREISR